MRTMEEKKFLKGKDCQCGKKAVIYDIEYEGRDKWKGKWC